MSDNDTNNSFASFMAPKSEGESKSSSGGIMGANKTKEALDKSKEDKEAEKKKELDEAKKNSVALANRYGKGDMMKMQARNLVMMMPFIILGAIAFLVLLFKGGDWLSKGLNTLFNIMVGNK